MVLNNYHSFPGVWVSRQLQLEVASLCGQEALRQRPGEILVPGIEFLCACELATKGANTPGSQGGRPTLGRGLCLQSRDPDPCPSLLHTWGFHLPVEMSESGGRLHAVAELSGNLGPCPGTVSSCGLALLLPVSVPEVSEVGDLPGDRYLSQRVIFVCPKFILSQVKLVETGPGGETLRSHLRHLHCLRGWAAGASCWHCVSRPQWTAEGSTLESQMPPISRDTSGCVSLHNSVSPDEPHSHVARWGLGCRALSRPRAQA